MQCIRRIRQLIPIKFATGYETREEPETEWTPMFSRWWMWLGRCYKVKHTPLV